jgi:GNAT superfamily N-acetyltransferase
MEVRLAESLEDFMTASIILDRTFGHLTHSCDYFSRLIPNMDFVYLAVETYQSKWCSSENIMGVYCLRVGDLSSKEEKARKYVGLKGIEGVALAVDKNHRGRGAGRLLREYSLTMDYDYIWGMQFKSLNNLDSWMKSGRELIYQTDGKQGINCTARMLPPKRQAVPEPEVMEEGETEDAKMFPLQFQRDAYSCGATTVEMYLNWTSQSEEVPDIEDIKNLCGTNPQTGTITEGILDCYQTLAIPAWRSSVFESQQDVTDPRELKEIEKINLQWLEGELTKGRAFHVRTLTHNCKHWILCYGFYYMNSTRYWLIADPSAGLIELVDHILVQRWKPRDWDGVVVDINYPIQLNEWAEDAEATHY